jgi:hypothetical protein
MVQPGCRNQIGVITLQIIQHWTCAPSITLKRKKTMMKAETRTRPLQVLVLVAVMLLAGASASLASHHEKENTTAADVKAEAAETYKVLKQYTLEQRDEAMAAAKQKLAELDVRIQEMQTKLDARWQDMSKATRVKTRETLQVLQRQREKVAEWYGGMRYSSEEAWEDVKKGFSDSYDRLKKAFQDASKDFENNS